ncbi:uncharacterized protein L969DRAFT_66418 [Mixia osmundae IAM 14324]|uniref:White collar 1 protein n=1 Tax=Mixia osmundae (strain CBS 9802 / IAM 14324 / JCM 22182 / KY 12970) TaxID=764103 RepID=G7DSU5_MIXOS|nr:uncharacterized protein L969DRAFT_66418 [Mixia osmundae IAM 14324]KEI37106.1 hypothetical protein L969DRAFT_66418 [Mixia osmundae IAM 14324]GAA93655.1 hypothetical protein E5Q_00300 [Mixia osmundae IAM 14324]
MSFVHALTQSLVLLLHACPSTRPSNRSTPFLASFPASLWQSSRPIIATPDSNGSTSKILQAPVAPALEISKTVLAQRGETLDVRYRYVPEQLSLLPRSSPSLSRTHSPLSPLCSIDASELFDYSQSQQTTLPCPSNNVGLHITFDRQVHSLEITLAGLNGPHRSIYCASGAATRIYLTTRSSNNLELIPFATLLRSRYHCYNSVAVLVTQATFERNLRISLSNTTDMSSYNLVTPPIDAAHMSFESAHARNPDWSVNSQTSYAQPANATASSSINKRSADHFDPTDEAAQGLDPSSFSKVTFQMPSFLAGGPAGQFASGPAIAEMPPTHNSQTPFLNMNSSFAAVSPTRKTAKYVPDPSNPVYGNYGSSVVGVNPDLTPFPIEAKMEAAKLNAAGKDEDFEATNAGLPEPIGGNFPGLYSSSGFDMVSVLARVAARPNPQINVGPVDTSCSFLVVDARKYDFPIVFASETFSKLTGYETDEIIGRNCRFLQAPSGDVQMGSRRKYTDSNAVYHMRTHVMAGKESQVSIINYRKNGQPFINLITIVPITWDTDEIAYFVGFQVDLVEQPNAILEKLRNGSYVVNYSLLPNTPFNPTGSSQAPNKINDGSLAASVSAYQVEEPMRSEEAKSSAEMLSILGTNYSDDGEDVKAWQKALLGQTHDLVHVLSLKGSLLYVSPSSARMLEYEPEELVGHTISQLCHPSDIIPVMRELKESSNATDPNHTVSLLYRIRRKNSGYIWIEAHGKLHLEPGKGRKCVILVGRERPIYRMSWRDVKQTGSFGDEEFWSKLSLDGLFLYSTSSVSSMLDFTADEMIGTSIYQLVRPDRTTDVTKALDQAAAGNPVSLHHHLKQRSGEYIAVVTHFHPHMIDDSSSGAQHPAVICQTNKLSSETTRTAHRPRHDGGVNTSFASNDMQRSSSSNSMIAIASPESSDEANTPSPFSAIPSTYKTLMSAPQSDNIFEELDATRSTSWQYELHQLKIINKKLREELELLEAAKRKRNKRKLAAAGGSGSPSTVKSCANCHTTSAPEWRTGPSGPKTLCNACGLRWAKATRGSGNSQTDSASSQRSASIEANSAVSSGSESAGPVPGYQPAAGFNTTTRPF